MRMAVNGDRGRTALLRYEQLQAAESGDAWKGGDILYSIKV